MASGAELLATSTHPIVEAQAQRALGRCPSTELRTAALHCVATVAGLERASRGDPSREAALLSHRVRLGACVCLSCYHRAMKQNVSCKMSLMRTVPMCSRICDLIKPLSIRRGCDEYTQQQLSCRVSVRLRLGSVA